MSARPPEEPVFFTDRDLGKRFPEILAGAGLNVRRHADHFAADATDPEWLEYVGAQGWVAITHDKRIRYKANEKQAVMDHGVRLLVVVGKAPLPLLAQNFVTTAPQIRSFIASHKGPWIAKVFRPSASAPPGAPGNVQMWLPGR